MAGVDLLARGLGPPAGLLRESSEAGWTRLSAVGAVPTRMTILPALSA